MTREISGRGTRARKIFLLDQILAMRPYVLGLIDDLRACVVRQHKLERMLKQPIRRDRDYAGRRARHRAEEELVDLSRQEQELRNEFAKLSVKVGDVLRGEMLFPCYVDDRDAFMIWFADEENPTHWRFRRDRDSHRIPQRWFLGPSFGRPRRYVGES